MPSTPSFPILRRAIAEGTERNADRRNFQPRPQSNPYDVLLVSEHFAGCTLASHAILEEASRLPAAQRRRQTIVLLGPDFTTNDDLEAFANNVDLVVALVDFVNLTPVLRRAVAKGAELSGPLEETLEILAAEEHRGGR